VSVFTLLFGPIDFLPQSYFFLIAGLILTGSFQAWALVPIIQEVQRAHADIEDKAQLNDRICGIFSAAFAMGEFIGPLLGNLLFNLYGFKMTTYIVSGGMFGFALLYFVCTLEPKHIIGKGGKLIPANRIRSDDVETAASLLS